MNVNVGDTRSWLSRQAVDVQFIVRVSVEKIKDAKRGAPPFRERTVRLKIPLAKSLPIHLVERDRRPRSYLYGRLRPPLQSRGLIRS
jgi:hypothetical protein